MKVVIVSPHFDDAVLSCWSLVDGEGNVDVITVFTAGPPPGIVTDWDSDTGVDSATRMGQRAEENRRALALAKRSPIDLGLLEGQYGGGGADVEVLAGHLHQADAVYVPAGIGVIHVNQEHIALRDACLSVRPDCCLYADQPYSQFRRDPQLPQGLGSGFERRVIRLTGRQRERKAQAVGSYAGEIDKLELTFGPITDPSRLRHEVFWIPAGTTGGLSEARTRTRLSRNPFKRH